MRNRTVRPSNIDIFESLLPYAVEKYPNLSVVKDHRGTLYLKGVLDLPNDIGDMVGHFLVEIHCSRLFPFKFPLMFETGGDIPQDADWHKNGDGSCCFTVWPDELMICRDGITIEQFITLRAIPYLANQVYRKQTQHYKNGEYAHGSTGLFDYYFRLNKEQLLETN